MMLTLLCISSDDFGYDPGEWEGLGQRRTIAAELNSAINGYRREGTVLLGLNRVWKSWQRRIK